MTTTLTTTPRTRGMAGRALHLVDLENLAGDPDAGPARVDATIDAYLAGAVVGNADLVAVAVNHRIYRRSCFSLDRGWEIKLASGPDAGDLALLDAAPVDWVVARFDRLVVGSGDGIFVDLVKAVRRRSVPAWVVARDDSLSGRLAAAASRVVRLGGTTGDETFALAA